MSDKDHKYTPESLMMSFGYQPELSEGSIKAPIFQTSTFGFKTAEEGKEFFKLVNGSDETLSTVDPGLIYSRINNPNLEILENRLSLWDQSEDAAVFESGIAAIATTLLEFLKPGDVLLHSTPLYGGSDYFVHSYLKKIGIQSIAFKPGEAFDEIRKRVEHHGSSKKLSMIYAETPANPTNSLIDISLCKKLADHFSSGDRKIKVAVDNTYMGPLWQHPLEHGADFSIYSATKYIGGHSDVIAGACCGKKEDIKRIKSLRSNLGSTASPHTSWLLMRSLETLKIRMEEQARNAQSIVKFLVDHPKIERVYYLGLISEDSAEHAIYKRQYSSPGAMVSFDVLGGEKNAFRFLNSLQLIKLAVSLGSTESLAQHPATMTHSNVSKAHREEMNITDKMVRMSVGIENDQDLIRDIDQALDAI